MEKILVPIEGKVIPREVLEEIKTFDYINKSPYSLSFYNVPNITWEHKPEGSLRISDHWNFISHGKKHCVLENREEYIENNWMLAKYECGKYHILKEFGENISGYKFIDLNKNDIELIYEFYNIGTIVNSKEWYRKYNIRPKLTKETHIKSRKIVSKRINSDRLKEFKKFNKGVKRVIYVEDKYLNIINKVMEVYKESLKINKLFKSDEGINILKKKYNVYKLNDSYELQSFDEIIILVFNNDMAINFKV